MREPIVNLLSRKLFPSFVLVVLIVPMPLIPNSRSLIRSLTLINRLLS